MVLIGRWRSGRRGRLHLDQGHAHKEDDERAPFERGELPAEDDDGEEGSGQNLQLVGHLWREGGRRDEESVK